MTDFTKRIFDVCEGLHLSHTGAGDHLTNAQYREYVEFLKDRLYTWYVSPVQSMGYDEAVRQLMRATLEELGEVPHGEEANTGKGD